MLPGEISFAGVRFRLARGAGGSDARGASKAPHAPDALVARGQTLRLPAGRFTRVYVLAASADGDRRATFRVGSRPYELTVQDWGGFIGQWDTRLWRQGERRVPPGASAEIAARIREPRYRQDPYAEMTGIRPGFVKPAPVAWFASHRHDAAGLSEAYAYSYLFAYALDVPQGARTLTLPDDERVRVLAVTVSDEGGVVRPAQALFDTLERGPILQDKSGR
jgi:alpha-mannosidase